MTSEVFTSYSRRDTETVDHIVAEMKESGLSVWIDREAIKAGNQWRVQIVQAIDTCNAFVLMVSPNSVASDNVRKEIDLAQDSQRPIFAVMLDPVKLPAEIRYQLAGLQFIDVKMLGFENAVHQLVETLREHIKKFEPEPAATRQVELVIQGMDISQFDAAKQAQLLDFLAQLSNADRSQLKLEKVAAGSVHAFVDMPSAAAFELKTLALNQDKRFKQLGIVALKLAGNQKYVNVASGKLTPMAAVGPLMGLWLKMPALFPSVLGVTGGKILTIAAVLAVATGIGLAVPKPTAPAIETSLPPTAIIPAASTLTSVPAPVSTETPTLVNTPTNIPTETPTVTMTATSTFTPTPAYTTLKGVVIADQLHCRYGPGEPYLHEYDLIRGNEIEFLGRMEIRSGDSTATWLYGLPQGYQNSCWVNARSIQLDGDLSSLEPDYYPNKAPLISFQHPNFPPPTNVEATRQGDQITITWTGYTLLPGDQEEKGRPIYLVEAWTCQAGKIVFTPIGYVMDSSVVEPIDASTFVRDEPGCSEPSHAQVFLAHKDGYVGPVPVPVWPPYPTPTP